MRFWKLRGSLGKHLATMKVTRQQDTLEEHFELRGLRTTSNWTPWLSKHNIDNGRKEEFLLSARGNFVLCRNK